MVEHFFLVWADWKDSTGAPCKKHLTQTDAEKEAESLAKKHPGTKFHVLAPIATVETAEPEVKWKKPCGERPIDIAAQYNPRELQPLEGPVDYANDSLWGKR